MALYQYPSVLFRKYDNTIQSNTFIIPCWVTISFTFLCFWPSQPHQAYNCYKKWYSKLSLCFAFLGGKGRVRRTGVRTSGQTKIFPHVHRPSSYLGPLPCIELLNNTSRIKGFTDHYCRRTEFSNWHRCNWYSNGYLPILCRYVPV